MTEEKWSQLFDLTRNQPEQVSVIEVAGWVAKAAAGIGFIAGLKLLLTKKMIMIGTISSVLTATVITSTMLMNNGTESKQVVRNRAVSASVQPRSGQLLPESKPNPLPGVRTSGESVAALPGLLPLPDLQMVRTPLAVPSDSTTVKLDDFTRIDAKGFVSFTLVEGTENKIDLKFHFERDPESFEYSVSNGRLKLNASEENEPEEVVITVKHIERIELDGFCTMVTSGKLTFDNLEVHLDGSTKATITADCGSLDVDGDGDTHFTFTGNVSRELDFDISEGSNFTFQGNAAESEVEMDGGCFLLYTGKTDSFDLEANGSSSVNYTGQAQKLDVESNGESKILLKGSSKDAHISLNGMGKLRAAEFDMEKLEIEMNGEMEGAVKVGRSLSVSINGQVTLSYTGSPQIVNEQIGPDCKLKKR